MITKISKWGNSLGLRLSKSVVDNLDLQEGSEVRVTEQEGKILIEPTKRDLTMAEMIDSMRGVDVLDQFEEVPPVGKEKFW